MDQENEHDDRPKNMADDWRMMDDWPDETKRFSRAPEVNGKEREMKDDLAAEWAGKDDDKDDTECMSK